MPRNTSNRAAARPPRDPVGDPTTAWALDVVEGRIIAGELVCHAAERHLRDLVDGPARGLQWDPAAAAHAIGFFPTMLTITGGLKVGQPFELLPYTLFLTGQIYGWRRADNGQRRFRTVWVETGKGQAKSPWMAALGLYEMRFLGVARSEIFAIASVKDQAGVLFRDAVSMVRALVPGTEETLQETAGFKVRGTGDNAWKIEYDGADAGLGVCSFRPIASGDSISGPKPRCVLGDEVHELKDDGPIEMWSQALAKVAGDPIMVLGTNTPSADQIVGCTYSDYYARVARGDFQDDSSLAFIATVDKGDDPMRDESCWVKALPALGITFEREKIADEVAKAAQLPSKALFVKRLYFGIRVGVADSWIDQGAWEAVQGEFVAEDMRGLPCWLGLDLSSRKDLTALAIVWRDDEDRHGRGREHLFVDVRYWTPRDTLYERAKEDKAPYDVWVEEGHLTAVPGPVIDKGFVALEAREINAAHEVELLAFDAAQIIDFETAAGAVGLRIWKYEGPDEPAGDGLKMVRHSQGFRGMESDKAYWMPRSVNAAEETILQRRITFRSSPVTRFCSSNMTLVQDAAGNRAPERRRSRGRIDGVVAAIMAIGAAEAPAGTAGRSFWDV